MKQKTHQGTKKRIKITKKSSGRKKLLKGSVVNSHNKRKYSASKKFRKKRKDELKQGHVDRIKKLLNI